MGNMLLTSLAEAFEKVRKTEATGVLRIASEGGLRMAFFENGRLVYFASDAPTDSLAAFLSAEGRLDSRAARETLADLQQPRRPLVSLVVDWELCDEARLRPWLVEYAYECLGRAMDTIQGTVRFIAELRADHPLPYSVEVPALVLECVRRMRNDEVLLDAVGPLDWCAVPAPDHADRLLSLPLDLYEGIIGSQLTAETTLEELIDVSGLETADALRAILALQLVGVLEPFIPPRRITSTGRLRLRKAAFESVSEVASVVVSTLGAPQPSRGEPRPITVDEFVKSTRPQFSNNPQPQPRPVAAEPAESRLDAALRPADPTPAEHMQPALPATPRRGNTSQLRVLASAYVQMAEQEAAAGNVRAACRYYEMALHQKPGDLSTMMCFAEFLMGRPDARGAVERLLHMARRANPTAAAPSLALARIYRANGQEALAREALAEARRVEPNNPKVLSALPPEPKAGLLSRLRGIAAAR